MPTRWCLSGFRNGVGARPIGLVVVSIDFLKLCRCRLFSLGLHALAAGSYRGSWSHALSGALWVSWGFLAIFPLQ
jgi:hypothetical protein